MIVISDTTPLNYLVLIKAIDVLPRLFTDVLIPTSVLKELTASDTPSDVRTFFAAPPPWITVADPHRRLPSVARLDAGEADAISLAKEREIAVILIDERIGRRVALLEGLIVLPTIAILERAAMNDFLDFQAAISALQQTTFRAPAEKIAAALARVNARKKFGNA